MATTASVAEIPDCIAKTKEDHSKITNGDAAEKSDEELNGDEPILKHPLQNSWCLWFYKNDRTKNWADNLKKITTFTHVEDFWALFNHIQPASKLPAGCDYSLFKEGIQPMWEDKGNVAGGRWLISLDKTQRQSQLDSFWIETLLLLIGEAFDEDSDEICGAVVNIRGKGDKLSIWTSNCNSRDAVMNIGKKIKERLAIPQKVNISYQSHDDQQQRSGSMARSQFTV